MEDKERAVIQEFDKLHTERHQLNTQIAELEKTNQIQGQKIRELEGVIMDAVADLKAGIE